MNWIFLDVAAVEALHEQQIVRFGGSHGLRDAGLLESAVHRAENKANYEDVATAATIAASLGWGLIKNHAFIDGNKRIGFVSVVAFLEAEWLSLQCACRRANHDGAASSSQRNHRRRMDSLGGKQHRQLLAWPPGLARESAARTHHQVIGTSGSKHHAIKKSSEN